MSKLVLAEKPSVAQSIARVIGANRCGDGYLEGNGYVVSWCVGHLVELAPPEAYGDQYAKWRKADLPIFPQPFRYQVSPSTKKQYGILKKLMAREDVESLVCATDAGREGELIFRLVYQQCGCRKPFERLWISSMEDGAIREGFEHLKAGSEYDSLYEAALCRERADWIVGINATRLFSCLYGTTLNTGRVMSPTLAMTVMREAAISTFQPEAFYTVQLSMDGFTVSSARMKECGQADALAEACRKAGIVQVEKIMKVEKMEKALALYDLTSLQREANRQLGYTAQQTLNYVQSLYEKKLVTYPRTDSRYLTDDMAATLPELAQTVAATFYPDAGELPVNAKQVTNSKKVTDHHAIIPTKELPKCNFQELSRGEAVILQMIALRLICAAGEARRYAETTAMFSCAETTFTVKGKTVLFDGWKGLEQKYSGRKTAEKKTSLPSLSEGDVIPLLSAEVKEGTTTPPKHFTEDTLLNAMETAGAEDKVNCPAGAREGGLGRMPEEAERKGLGTPATRAGIIEKLVQKGFLERKGDKKVKYLIPTQKGISLVTILPEQIQSPAMIADWEEKLLKVERNEYSADSFMEEICGMMRELIDTYEIVEGADVLMQNNTVIGKCPHCGKEVVERQKGWFCSNSECRFVLWADHAYFNKIGKHMTRQIAGRLLRDGHVRLKACKSQRTGKEYDATVRMTTEADGRPRFQMEFGKGGK
ncbi:MAG: DNA topoisomerase 3 [Lachnospiraceae bacterium]|nr:DNA topoisomerase 3 [Lachnospiraceae bacterium]